MSKEIKFTEKEIKEINDLRMEVAGIFSQLGQVSIERNKKEQELKLIEEPLMKRHSELTLEESTLFKVLNAKYGDGNFDLETGIFTPVEPKTEK